MTSPVDSLTEDIDLLIASIGLLSSIVDNPKRPREVAIIGKSPRNPALSLPSTPVAHDKDPPCDVPRGIEETSCPPSPSSAPVLLRLDLPNRFSDEETASRFSISSEDSLHSDSERVDGATDLCLLTPQPSLQGGDSVSPISSSTVNMFEEGSFPVLDRLHIEQHIMSARSSQVLPLSSTDSSPVTTDAAGVASHRPYHMPPETTLNPTNAAPNSRSSPNSSSETEVDSLSQEDKSLSSRQECSESYGNTDDDDAATVSESPVVRNLREFSRLYDSKPALFGTHSRTRSAPINNLNQIPPSLLSGSGPAPHLRTRPGRPTPLEATENVRSMIDLFPLPPVPRSPPPVPPTPEGYVQPPSRQPSMRLLPSQLRYQLSQGSLRRPLPDRLPPLNSLNNRPRPLTEFHADENPASSSSFAGKDPRLGALPYTSPPGKTHFSIYNVPTTRSPMVEQEEYPPVSTPRPNFDQQRNEQNTRALPRPYENDNGHTQPDHPAQPAQLYQYHRGPSSPSVFSEMSMSHSDPELNMDDDMDDDDAQSYMSDPLDGMRSPISPSGTIFLEGRPRPRRTRADYEDEMSQPKSFFDLGFDMDIGKLEKRSRWRFWSKIRRHRKRME